MKSNSTDKSIYFMLQDSVSGAPYTTTGNETDVNLIYTRQGAAQVSTNCTGALAAATTAHTDNKIFHTGNGIWRADFADAAFASGADHVQLMLTDDNSAFLPAVIEVPFEDSDAIQTIDDELATVDGKIDTIDTNVDTALTNQATIEGKIDTIDSEVGVIDGKVDVIDTNVDTALVNQATIEGKIDTVDSNVDAIKAITDTLADIDSTGGDATSIAKAVEAILATVLGEATVTSPTATTKRVIFAGRDGTTEIVRVDVSTTTSGQREASTIS